MKEAVGDLQGLVDTITKYTRCDRAERGKIPNQNQNKGKRKLIEDSDENIRADPQNQGSFMKPDKRTRANNSEKTLQEPCPKHSRPERPANHSWEQCYHMLTFKQQWEKTTSSLAYLKKI